MPCPHRHSSNDEDSGIDRREFMKAAVAIGGASALATARARAHGDSHDEPPGGTDDPDSLPDRQYAWNDHCETNDTTGLAKTPKHHLQLMLDYAGDGTPTEAEREQVEAALRTLERGFEWSHEGLLFTIGYSPAYFDRFDADLPEDTGLRSPEEVIEASDINRSGKIEVDDYDAHVHLASDNAVVLLEAEEALFGNVDAVNADGEDGGTEVEATFEGIFEKRDRRTGFINNPHEQWEEHIDGKNPVGEDADVWFGFKSLFEDSQPDEEHVAISDPDHPFVDATTEQASLLRDDGIKEWYNRNSHEERAARMYSPHHTSEETGQHGRELGDTSGTDDESMAEIAAQTEADAETEGVVGHAQKLARARKGEDGTPPLLRRDFPSTDGNRAHTQFISNQRTIDDFIDVRKAMAFVDTDEGRAESEVPIKDHGIQGYFQVQSRGTFLVPSRLLRALPPADPR